MVMAVRELVMRTEKEEKEIVPYYNVMLLQFTHIDKWTSYDYIWLLSWNWKQRNENAKEERLQ
jgi:hypothetical protein